MLYRPNMFLYQQADDKGADDSGSAGSGKQNDSGSDEQSWKERHAGLHKEYSRVERELKAQTKINEDLSAQVNRYKGELNTTVERYEGQLVEIKSTLTAKEKAEQSLLLEKEQLSSSLTKLERDNQIRQKLSKPEYQGLAPWYDSGLLRLDGIEDDAMETTLAAFKGLLDTKTASDMQTIMGSTTPPQMKANQGNTVGMNRDQLNEWLFANPGHPEYAKHQEAYYDLVSKDGK